MMFISVYILCFGKVVHSLSGSDPSLLAYGTSNQINFMNWLKNKFLNCLVANTKDQSSHVMARMGLVMTKPVFRVSDKARLKPVSSATETS